jgi:hypothetical protein
MIGSEKTTQKTFQWQEDTLRAQATNAQVEGFTAEDVAITPTTLRSNVCANLRRGHQNLWLARRSLSVMAAPRKAPTRSPRRWPR